MHMHMDPSPTLTLTLTHAPIYMHTCTYATHAGEG
jgi:hypothetical protein